MFLKLEKGYGKISYPIELLDINRQIERDLDKVITYYQGLNKRTSNKNPLVKIFDLANPDHTVSLSKYLNGIGALSRDIANALKMTTYNVSGIMHRDVVFTDVDEIILNKSNLIDVGLKSRWRTYSAITVLDYDSTSLSYTHPSDRDMEYGTVAYSINIAMMLLQYRYWSIEKAKNGGSTEPSLFIQSIVLTNIIPQLTDYAIYNRYIYIANGLGVDDTEQSHPFLITNIDNKLNKVIGKITKKISRNEEYIEDILKNIPLVDSEDLFTLFDKNDDQNNTQNIWAVWLSFIRHLYNILTLCSDKTLTLNRTTFSNINIFIRIIDTNVDMERYMNHDKYLLYKSMIDYIKSVIRKK